MKPLNRFSDCVSPMSWNFIFLASLPPMYVLLKPSLTEFLVMLVVDTVAFVFNRAIEGKIFKWIYPDTALYFDGIDYDSIAQMSLHQKIGLFESFMTFPKRRAIYLSL